MLHVGMNFAHGFLGADVLSNTHVLIIHVPFVIILWGSFTLRVTIVFMHSENSGIKIRILSVVKPLKISVKTYKYVSFSPIIEK